MMPAKPLGSLLVCAGLALAGSGGAPAAAAPSGNSNAQVGVNNTITLSGVTASFTMTADPKQAITVPSAVTMNVKCNNPTGYVVSVQAGATDFVGTDPDNPDTFPVTELKVTGTTAAREPVTQASAKRVHSRPNRTTQTGDDISNDYSMTVPWVAPDTYTVTLDYIAAAQ